MSLVKISTIAVVLSLSLTPTYAGPKGGGATHGPAAKGPAARASSVKVTPVKGSSGKAPKVSKVTTTGAAKSPKADTRLARVDAKSAKSKTTTTTSTSNTTSGTTSSTTTSTITPTTQTAIDFTASPVGEKLSKNSALRSKLESRLMAIGYEGTVYQAAYGFKNQGQFVAATNVSRNLGISFDQLKLQMTGLSVDTDGTVLQASLQPDGTVTMIDPADVTKPAPTTRLGQAIQTVKSTVDATATAETATTQANIEIQSTETASK